MGLSLEIDVYGGVFSMWCLHSYMFYYCDNVKNERTNVMISFWKRNETVLVSFPNLSCWEKIVSIWSRVWKWKWKCALSMGQIREQTQTSWFHCCWMSERLWNVCSFAVLTFLPERPSVFYSSSLFLDTERILYWWQAWPLPFVPSSNTSKTPGSGLVVLLYPSALNL
jgi:hypothetical protein